MWMWAIVNIVVIGVGVGVGVDDVAVVDAVERRNDRKKRKSIA
jgi:hypothetical protein